MAGIADLDSNAPMSDLRRWLDELGLREYGPLFDEHKIDLSKMGK